MMRDLTSFKELIFMSFWLMSPLVLFMSVMESLDKGIIVGLFIGGLIIIGMLLGVVVICAWVCLGEKIMDWICK